MSNVEIARRLKSYSEKFELICRGDRLLVAVSGGPDSVALLRLLIELRGEFQLDLEVAHLEHGLRGEEAREDARFVAALAQRFELPFHLREISVPGLRAAAGKGNLEALARQERYRFFAEVLGARGLTKVATAHTQDDQAETVLMWLLRGSGMKGLGGMAPLQQMTLGGHKFTVIRPLLASAKADLLGYLTELRQQFRVDGTNRDPSLLRNWIRLELLPKIHQRFDARVSERLGQLAEVMRGEDALLVELARRRLQEIVSAKGLNRAAFLAEPPAMQRRLLRLWIESARGSLRGLDFDHIDELIRLIKQGPPQARLALPGGWELACQYGDLNLVRRSDRVRRYCFAYDFAVGSTLSRAEAGWQLYSELVAAPLERLPADLMEAVFDAGCLTEPLTVRNFRNGDYFQPLGMAGHKKIKDLFIECKVPLDRRAALPLLALGPEVLWVPGYGRSERAKVTSRTTSILHLKLVEMMP